MLRFLRARLSEVPKKRKKGDGHVSNQLVKADAVRKKKGSNPNSLLGALKGGGPIVWLSCIVMGLGNIVAGQFIKGLIFLAIEAAVLFYMFMPEGGIYDLKQLPELGDVFQVEVWNEDLGVYEYITNDPSWKLLLYGVVAVAFIVFLIVIWQASVRSGNMALLKKKQGKHVNNFWEDIKSLFDENIHKLLMTFPFVCLVVFTIIPLVYMICMAFTDYSSVGDHTQMFNWVGFETFAAFFRSGSVISEQFTDVLIWTLIWAFFATFLNFFFGTFVAMIINRPTTKLKGVFRTIFSLTIAVPQFVSLLIVKNMFEEQGIINLMLKEWGLVSESVPFLTDATTARCFVIIVNLWVGIPYTIMQVTGILKNIPGDLYEAAKIDGANVVKQFIYITLPYMIFVMTPYIITSFTGNINNFNVIYLLTGGAPGEVGKDAGQTDLLVTWLYKMSVDLQKYNVAAVIGIFTFVILAIVSLVTYRSSGSYKDEEGFK